MLVSVYKQLYELVSQTQVATDAKINTFMEHFNQDLLVKERKVICYIHF